MQTQHYVCGLKPKLGFICVFGKFKKLYNSFCFIWFCASSLCAKFFYKFFGLYSENQKICVCVYSVHALISCFNFKNIKNIFFRDFSLHFFCGLSLENNFFSFVKHPRALVRVSFWWRLFLEKGFLCFEFRWLVLTCEYWFMFWIFL